MGAVYSRAQVVRDPSATTRPVEIPFGAPPPGPHKSFSSASSARMAPNPATDASLGRTPATIPRSPVRMGASAVASHSIIDDAVGTRTSMRSPTLAVETTPLPPNTADRTCAADRAPTLQPLTTGEPRWRVPTIRTVATTARENRLAETRPGQGTRL